MGLITGLGVEGIHCAELAGCWVAFVLKPLTGRPEHAGTRTLAPERFLEFIV